MSNRHLSSSEILNVIHYFCISNSEALLTDGRNTSVTILTVACSYRRDTFCKWPNLTVILSNENIYETYVCELKWPNHGTRRESAKESNHSLTYLHSDGFTKAVVFSVSLCVVPPVSKELPLGKKTQGCAWRHLNRTRKFHNHWKECIC